jgi:hypothetical protein
MESFCTCADDPGRFTVELDHNGFFYGLKEHLQYVSGTVDYFDNCNTDTFSILCLENFLKQGGNEMTDKSKFYRCVSRSDMRDDLCLIQNDANIIATSVAIISDVQASILASLMADISLTTVEKMRPAAAVSNAPPLLILPDMHAGFYHEGVQIRQEERDLTCADAGLPVPLLLEVEESCLGRLVGVDRGLVRQG